MRDSNPAGRREDGVLAKALRGGNRRAWKRFSDLYAAPLFRFVAMRLDDRQDGAEDVTQDAIMGLQSKPSAAMTRREEAFGDGCVGSPTTKCANLSAETCAIHNCPNG